MRRVAVTGIGVASPLGLGSEAFWEGLTSGRVAIGPITRYDASGFACQVAGEVPAFKVSQHVPKTYRKAAKVMARDIELAVLAAEDAFATSGLQSKAHADGPSFDVERFGCNIGAGLISCDLDELASALDVARRDDDPARLDLGKWGGEGMQKLTPLWLLKYLPNMLACHVTIIHGLMGPSNTITCAEASSHLAIGEAFRTIQRDDADYAICGGAEGKVNPMGHVRHELLGRLNGQSNDDPHHALRPYADDADGSVHGEGGGLLILEEWNRAKDRGATIYAELVGFGASQDAHAILEPDPAGHSAAAAMNNALKDASATAGDVGLLVPHGTGHVPSDAAEFAAMRKVFGDALGDVPVSVPTAQTGNLHAGCGQSVAATVLALHHQTIPPAVNTAAGLNAAATTRDASVDLALTTITSLGGQNAALVLRKAD